MIIHELLQRFIVYERNKKYNNIDNKTISLLLDIIERGCMKKIICILIIVLIATVITGCKKSDSIKFKNEYEKLNNQKVGETEYQYPSISIPKNNKIIYKTDDEIIDVIKNETAVIYFGFNSCPWCRSMIENLIEVTDELNIEKVYYVNVKDIRDTLEFDEIGNIVRTKNGTISYNELLNLLSEHLDYYTITDKDGNEVETKEKRIYAPNVVVVKDGKVLGLTTGVSENLENPFKEIDEETKKESYDMLYDLISKIKPINSCVASGAC